MEGAVMFTGRYRREWRVSSDERDFNNMVIIVFSAAVWLFLGWKLGLAIVVGAILESIEVVVMLRAVSRLRREKAELINFLNDAAIHLETAVQEVGSRLENNSLVNP
jgi:hypothetical protein